MPQTRAGAPSPCRKPPRVQGAGRAEQTLTASSPPSSASLSTSVNPQTRRTSNHRSRTPPHCTFLPLQDRCSFYPRRATLAARGRTHYFLPSPPTDFPSMTGGRVSPYPSRYWTWACILGPPGLPDLATVNLANQWDARHRESAWLGGQAAHRLHSQHTYAAKAPGIATGPLKPLSHHTIAPHSQPAFKHFPTAGRAPPPLFVSPPPLREGPHCSLP